MACIKRLGSDILFDCANLGAIGGTGEIDEAIIINSSDIATVSEVGGVGTITIKTPDDARGENRITIISAAWTTITAAKIA